MKKLKAIVIYDSKNGVTKKYGEEISEFLRKKDFDAKAVSINNCSYEDILESDYVLLGSWTNGFFLFGQHPNDLWVNFVKTIPNIKDKKIGLFATYKISTGSIFKKMKKHLGFNDEENLLELKSRDGSLQVSAKLMINDFLKS